MNLPIAAVRGLENNGAAGPLQMEAPLLRFV